MSNMKQNLTRYAKKQKNVIHSEAGKKERKP